jgi:IS30 family transposase
MGRRGPSPDHAKREAFAKLIAEGVPSGRACRMVGINRRTGKRWRNGRRIPSGGRVLNLPPVITPAVPVAKRYSARYLSEDERVCLADLRQERRTMRDIAALMGRSLSTISRELARGADAVGRYGPFEAHRRALGRRRLHRPSRLARDAGLRDWVAGRLQARWSPEQVARRLRHEFPGQPWRWLCAETIYQAVYRPDLGGLPRELPGRVLLLRRRHRLRRRDARARRAGPLTGMTLIHDRPAEALGREQPGHWEGDLIVGAGNASAIVTIVERTTRFTLLGHLPGPRHDSATVRDAVLAALGGLPPHLRRTLTWDQGSEMARHTEIAAALGTTGIYFCDPHSPWQRPSNENTNGLLRAYFPKSTDLSVHTEGDIALVQLELNSRPRKVLGWDSPADRLATLLRSPPSVLRR